MTEATLLDAIRASPDDDQPRLVYADWLAEQGRAREAEHIRAGLAIHRDLADHEARLAAYRTLPDPTEAGFPEDLAVTLTYERGFARAADLEWRRHPVRADDWERALVCLERSAPLLTDLTISLTSESDGSDDGHLALPDRLPEGARALTLVFFGRCYDNDWLQTLPSLLERSALSELSVYHSGPTPLPPALVSCPRLADMSSLVLRGQVERIETLPEMPALEALEVAMAPTHLELPALRSLRLQAAPQRTAMRWLARGSLRHLQLGEPISPELALPEQLRSLSLASGRLDEAAAGQVASCQRLRRLQLGFVEGNTVGAWRQLLGLPELSALSLQLSGSYRRFASAWRRAARCPSRLTLDTRNHPLDRAEDAEGIVRHPQLRALKLIATRQGSPALTGALSGADQLVELCIDTLGDARSQPRMPQLRRLELRWKASLPSPRKLPALRALTAESASASRLAKLELHRFRLRTASRAQLARLRAAMPQTVVGGKWHTDDHVATIEWWTPPLEGLS